MTSFIIDLHNKCAYIYYKTEVAHYDRNSGSHISGMVAQAYRTGGSLEHRLFTRSAETLQNRSKFCSDGPNSELNVLGRFSNNLNTFRENPVKSILAATLRIVFQHVNLVIN